MTPVEHDLLSVLVSWNAENITSDLATWVFYGISVPLVATSLGFLLQRDLESRSRKILLVALIVVYFANTWYFGILCVSRIQQVKVSLVSNDLSAGLEKRITGFQKNNQFWDAQSVWIIVIKLVVSDGLVSWRACAVWPGVKFVRFLFIGLMSGNIVINLAQSVSDSLLAPDAPLNFRYNSLFISFGVNMIATVTIALKLWHHYRATRSLYVRSRRFSPAVQVLLLLVESGAVFCIAQLAVGVITIYPLGVKAVVSGYVIPTAVYEVINVTFNGVLTIYPLAVLLLVTLKQSPLEETFSLQVEESS